MPDTLQIVVLLLLAAMALGMLGRRIGIPYPIVLTAGGLALGFIPGLPAVRLHPDVVFGAFLPPILYHAAIFGRWHDFRANARPIGRLAILLVAVTTVAIAGVTKLLIPEFPWAAAFILGAIISPPDAVAVTAILRRLRLPPRLVAIIEGESLFNDAAAIILYKFALAAALTGAFSLAGALGQFVLVVTGGVVLGVALGWVSVWVNKLLKDTLSETMLSLAMPFLSYQIAEAIGVSGVLTVIVVGFWRTTASAAVVSAETRLRNYAMWDAVVFFLNSLIFTLIGLQLPLIVRQLADFSWATLIGYAAAISLTAIVTRCAWVGFNTYIGRLTARRRKRQAVLAWRDAAMISYVGLRGIVSLAVALSIPLTRPDGSPFPERDLIIFLTFAIIVTTIIVQGLSLPMLLRVLRFDGTAGADLGAEEEMGRVKMAYAAVAEIDRITERDGLPARITERVRAEFAMPLAELGAADDVAPDAEKKRRLLRLAGIQAARRRLVKLHRDDDIGDGTLRTLMTELDFDEMRVHGVRSST